MPTSDYEHYRYAEYTFVFIEYLGKTSVSKALDAIMDKKIAQAEQDIY